MILNKLYLIGGIFLISFSSQAQCSLNVTLAGTPVTVTAYLNPYNTNIICYGPNNFNYSVDLSYNVVVSPTVSLYNLQGYLTCSNPSNPFYIGFTNTGGNAQITTTQGSYNGGPIDCPTANVNSLNCIGATNFRLVVGADGGNTEINCPTVASAFPVTLKMFNGIYSSGEVSLDWETSADSQIDYFQVEKSYDARSFEPTSLKLFANDNNKYAWVDKSLSLDFKTAYYRLKSIDREGKTEFSRIIGVEIFDPKSEWTVSPNPAHENLTIRWNKNQLKANKIEVFDNYGRELYDALVDMEDLFNFRISEKGKFIVIISDKFGRSLSKKVIIE